MCITCDEMKNERIQVATTHTKGKTHSDTLILIKHIELFKLKVKDTHRERHTLIQLGKCSNGKRNNLHAIAHKTATKTIVYRIVILHEFLLQT